ncbi:peptidoglycan-binding protein [Ruminococcus sp. 1001275B_160808_F8]|jgi:tape measure domain-containing protein|uniref:peptidoglycan-binding protein n=1 Tax=unclassified Ruminococcus TaxID=2608920 RepID=UPI0018AC889D|nr:peptidoglycan-binding protein [Ruminococcus sp. 1001275B_160808_F8]
MSKTVDERVVEMRFDNKQFESNVQTSLSTIGKLKQSLDLRGASKGLENVSAAAKTCNLSGLTGAVETVQAKFSALEVMAVTALANITNSAVNAGKRIISALTIEPVRSGFEEYETQINAIQTILANTESKGSTLQDVNQALDELNHYADLTIYNFTEMTRNIGTFTAAGVDLETSVSAIKGIANLAAVSGSTSQQASTAMYQLSQALAAGTVKLQDWNSVVNAGMGGQVFQDALKETARVHGIAIDQMITDEGSFRETLSKGWLTAEVLTETLSKFTGDLTESQLKQMGYTDEQITSIIKMGQTANDAATKVKTLSQLFDTLKEAAQSGWTQTWELIIGDFDQAKELFTGISDSVSNMLNASADRRNNLLEGALSNNWEKLISKINEAGIETKTFEEQLKETATAHGLDVETLIEQYGSLEKVFRSGAASTDILKEAVNSLRSGMVDLSSVSRDLDMWSTGDDVKKVQEALQKQGLDIGQTGVDGILGPATQSAIKAFQELKGIEPTGIVDEATLNALKEATSETKNLTGNIDKLIDGIDKLGGREKLIESFKNIFKTLGDVIKPVKEAFNEVFPPTTSKQLSKLIDKFKSFTDGLKISDETSDKLKRTFKGVFSAVDLLKKGFSSIISPIGKFLGSGGLNGIIDGLLNITASVGDFLTSLNESGNVSEFLSKLSDGIFDTFRGIAGVIDPALEKVESLGDVFSVVKTTICNAATNIFDAVKNVFSWIKENVSAGDLFAGLAGGGIFAVAKKLSGVLSTIKEGIEGLFEKKTSKIAEQFSDLLNGVKDAISSFTTGIKVASLVGIAAAIAILSVALNSIAKIDPDKVVTSLSAIGVMLGELSGTLFVITKVLSKNGSKGLIKAGASMVLIAAAVKVLAAAMVKMADLSWEKIGKGLTAMGGGLLELSAAMKIINGAKVSLSTSVAMLALAKSCQMLGDALAKFSVFSWDEIGRGLSAMGGALAEMTASLSVLSKAGGFGALLGGTGMLIAVQSLDEISENIERLGNLSWEQIKRGLAAMGGALGEFTASLSILSAVGGFGSLLGGTGLLVAVQSLDEISENLERLGALSWDEIGKGLAAMGGALGELTASLGILSAVGGFGSLLGATGILIAVQALEPIAMALSNIGSLSWEEIGKGLAGMGGALAEFTAALSVLSLSGGFGSLLGGTAVLIAAQSLEPIATTLSEIGAMDWDEIAKGLVGMGGALTEVGVVSALVGNLGGLGSLIGSASLTLGVQGLGELANALTIFGTMDWDEIGRGLTAMAGALGETALGGLLNTFSGFGAAAIAAMAEPLGNLADSVKRWSGVIVPDGLGTQLGSLATGVQKFNFSGWGADAIGAMAIPLGDLADSISKWKDVIVPDGIGDGLSNLADGVKAFNFSGWGADAMADVATPLGTMADSIKKWDGIIIPEDLGTNLSYLANGVYAWSTVGPSDIVGITEPLGTFADSVKKWNDVSIPSNLETALTGFANGINACNNVSVDNVTNVCTSVKDLGTAVSDISTIDFSGSVSKLSDFAAAIGNVSVSTDSFKILGTTIVTDFAASLKSGVSTVSEAGGELAEAVATGMRRTIDSIVKTASSIANSAKNSVANKKSNFVTAGSSLMLGLAAGLRSSMGVVTSASGSAASAGASASRAYYSSFYSSGVYLVSGFAAGIRDNISSAASAAAQMASEASKAARSSLDINSPSKVFYRIGGFAGQGFVNALVDYSKAAYDAGSNIGLSAREGLSRAIYKATEIVSNGIDNVPTIRPVLDLSAVRAGANEIGGILGMDHAIGLSGNLGAITTMMAQNQNGNSSDVVDAINRLGKKLNNLGNTYNNIGGVTYDDTSGVSDAIEILTRAVVVEGRR